MNRTKISAEVVAHSLSPQGDELISVLCTFPRIILAEVNTHRMLSKNTSSLRAIPFKKMVEAVQDNPFIPIAWQKHHSGMQGSEYITDQKVIDFKTGVWLQARNEVIKRAEELNGNLTKCRSIDDCEELEGTGVTKQLANRLLEPFMWTTMLITGSKESWDNFFKLRCPDYEGFKSRKEASKEFLEKGNIDTSNWSDLDWLHLNKGQAEIHIMDLAEKIYDAVNESIPKKLAPNSWHIPFSNKIPFVGNLTESIDEDNTYWKDYDEQNKVKISVAMAARTSYTVVGEEKDIDYKKMIELHDNLLAQEPIYSSSLEHCAKTMNNAEYESFYKGQIGLGGESGWCESYRGFRSYKHLLEAGELKF